MRDSFSVFDLNEQLALLGRDATAARKALAVVATEIDGALSNMLQFLGRYGAGLAKESMLTYGVSGSATYYDPANVATSAIASVVFMGRLRCPRTRAELEALIGTIRNCGFETDGSRAYGKAGHQEALLKQRVVGFLCQLGSGSEGRATTAPTSLTETATNAPNGQITPPAPNATAAPTPDAPMDGGKPVGKAGTKAKRKIGRRTSLNSLKSKLLKVVARAGRINAGAAAKAAGIRQVNTAYKYAAAFEDQYSKHFGLDEDEKGARVFEWACPTPNESCPECARLGAKRRRSN